MGHAYETIVAWQKADDLAVEIYRVTATFPSPRSMVLPRRCAAVSVAANIAEGAARQYMKEYQQFLYLAKASLAELSYHIHLAHRLGFIGEADSSSLDALRSDAGRPLQGLLEWVERQVAQGITLNKRVAEASELYATVREPPTANCQPPTENRLTTEV
jgi:four helix bundle protein